MRGHKKDPPNCSLPKQGLFYGRGKGSVVLSSVSRKNVLGLLRQTIAASVGRDGLSSLLDADKAQCGTCG